MMQRGLHVDKDSKPLHHPHLILHFSFAINLVIRRLVTRSVTMAEGSEIHFHVELFYIKSVFD